MKFLMSSKMYDMVKWIALILLPALGTFYYAMAITWGFPYTEQIVGTFAAVDVFLGVLLGISEAQYILRNSYVLRNSLTDIDSDAVKVSWVLSNEAYDVLKYFAQIVLPALATLYFSISQIWGLPLTQEVVSTIMAFATLLGMVVGFSNSQYNKKAAFACLGEIN